MIFDSHVHLDDPKFDTDRDKVIEDLEKNGICGVINIGSDLNSSLNSINLAQKYEIIYAAIGTHPSEVGSLDTNYIENLNSIAKNSEKNKKIIAVGEIGLDYHYGALDKDAQKFWFKEQLKVAKNLNLPIIIHSRDAFDDTWHCIDEIGYFRGVFHCFSYDWTMAQIILDAGFYISFAGNLTYKKSSNLIECVNKMPLNRILVETDCPYLPPDGFRGQRNEPKYIVPTIQKMAEIKNLSVNQVAQITQKSISDILGIS